MRTRWPLAILLLLTTSAASAQQQERPRQPWDAGRFNLALAAGSQNIGDSRYIVIGAGVGYYVLPGLEVGAYAARWFGDSPGVTQLSPSLRYVVTPIPFAVKPYVGAFYNHWLIEDGFSDVNSVGGRLGAIWPQAPVVINLGVAVEKIVSECNSDCTDVYPEIGIGVVF